MLCIYVQSVAQCFSFTESQIPPNSSFVVPLVIEGAALDDLSDPDQCVAAVAVSFSHPRVSELEIFLISPFGDTITLVSGGGITFTATNNTDWNITFLPCSENVAPDNDFNPNFTNTENWGVFGDYSGLYYPYEGCLEDFDSGPVNGTWQLLIVNNSAFNEGTLIGFSLFFCNDDGLDCFICQATQSTISLENIEYCLGSDDLLLDFERTFTGLAPDPDEYGYDYLLFRDSILLSSSPFLDLRDTTSGEYTICGVSYLLEDTMSLLTVGDKIDFDEFRFTLTSDTASFCGRLSNCIDVSINEPIDTTFENRFICQGDTLFIGMDTLVNGGIYDIIFQTNSTCDSTVQIDLTIIDFDLVSNITLGLDCNELEQTLVPVVNSTNVDPSFLFYVWTDISGDTLSQSNSFVVDSVGIYELVVNIVIDGILLCSFQSTYTVRIIPDDYVPVLSLPDILCPFETYEITLVDLVSGTDLTWSVTPPQDIIGAVDSSTFTFILNDPQEIDICVLLENDCFQDTTYCERITINQFTDIEILAQDTVCGNNSIISAIGLTEVSAIVVAGPSTEVDFDIMDSDIIVSIMEPGEYTIEVNGLNNGCPFYSLETIFFLGLPNITFEIESNNDCIEPGITIISENLSEVDIQLFGSLNGIPFEFTVIPGLSQLDLDLIAVGSNTVVLDYYKYSTVSACNYELMQEITIEISPVLTFPDIIPVCNDTIGNNITRIDFSSIFNYPVDIISISLEGFAGEIAVPLVDFLGIQPGEYDFNVVLNPGGGCPSIDTIIQIEVQDCSCPLLIGGNITYDFCGTSETNLDDFVSGDWQINWDIVSTPPDALLNIVNGILVFSELRSGIYEFTGTVVNIPDGCNPNISLILNATELFNSGNLIHEDTLIICLNEGESEVQLFDYIQNFDSGGQWRKLSEQGMMGALDGVSGLYSLSGFGKTISSFSYSAMNSDECSQDSTILQLVIYRQIEFAIPDQFFLTCGNNAIEIDIERYLNVDGWDLNITALEGGYEFVNSGNSIRVTRESIIQFEFVSEGNSCVNIFDVSVLIEGDPISEVILNVFSPICASDDGEGFIEVTEILGGVGPFSVQLNELILLNQPHIFSDLTSGSYLLNITDSNGCTFDSLIQLGMMQSGFISLGEDLYVTSGMEITIGFDTNIAEDSIGSIVWELDGMVICEGCSMVEIIASQGQVVMLTLSDLNGCIYRDSLSIFAEIQVPFFLPNAFSPNSDNINEVLFIYPRSGLVEILEWKIFDRWGSAVFESGPFDPFTQELGWDGQFRGRMALPGIYLSSIRYLLINGRSVYHVSEINVLR